MRVFVHFGRESWDEETLLLQFGGFGEIEKVVVPICRLTGGRKCYGFVFFRREADAKSAEKSMHGKRIGHGQFLKVSSGTRPDGDECGVCFENVRQSRSLRWVTGNCHASHRMCHICKNDLLDQARRNSSPAIPCPFCRGKFWNLSRPQTQWGIPQQNSNPGRGAQQQSRPRGTVQKQAVPNPRANPNGGDPDVLARARLDPLEMNPDRAAPVGFRTARSAPMRGRTPQPGERSGHARGAAGDDARAALQRLPVETVQRGNTENTDENVRLGALAMVFVFIACLFVWVIEKNRAT
uniref:RRM domain-containing protein n=1 Tax=Chromera velia CCMP2878 TaxID=1169474 RepID=A0A0G4IB52_9ALVE|eukprot:Cvel_12736.t1-p1 / transcript=Cvel_12736.t1 / gene=Cvel_12736 / organism=Chromera_velia_CCMP2878 / gene_product=hypothetical protein / transcript_product=hypothetical protein / location=Cvel_scaffold846:42540-43421(-) / protein_length=294 / sequence_SO=supercontig / SO=protein_coding / is_pseudo=false